MIIRDLDPTKKEDAYYLDFHFKEQYLVEVLHNVLIEHNNSVEKFDHILITPSGISIMDIKNFNANLQVQSNGSLKIVHNKIDKTFPSPLKSLKAKEALLKDYLTSKLNFNIKIDSFILFGSQVTVKNKTLPKNFMLDYEFIRETRKKIELSCVRDNFKELSKQLNMQQIDQISSLLSSTHVDSYSTQNIALQNYVML